MSEPGKPVGAIFDAAMELPPERRATYVQEACAGDDSLRLRVEALLRAHESAGTFMNNPAAHPNPQTAVVRPAEQIGDRIGRYKLLQQIGEGGCGVVYMAEQEEPVRRRVALKVIKLGMDTKNVIARFEAERQALALMDHPNIAKVLEAGAPETGRPYFVMELVRGVKITDYCNENSLSTVARLELFIQVCQAIQHAHQKGIIHRDIKPSNILVADHDGKPVPKIIDFGIAKATSDQRLTDKTLFTAFEQFIGTPAYMSPEQARLSGLDIDTRSDIYSLGVLLYELLMGKTPFESDRLLKAGLDEIRRIIREEEPLRPSTRLQALASAEQTTVARHRQTDPPKLAYLIRGDLDWIVMKALEKDRARRYETANGLAMDVQRYLADDPILARPPSKVYRLQKMIRRNKLVCIAAALMAAVLVVATGISVLQAFRAKRAETAASERLAESEAISKFLTEVFQSPDPARDSRTITVAEALAAAAKKLEVDLVGQPARQATLRATLGSTFLALGLYGEAIPLREKVRDYYLTVYGLENTNTLNAMQTLATVYDKADRQAEAFKLREQVLPLCRKILGSEHPDTITAISSLARSYDEAGRYDEALRLREQVLALRRKVLGPEHPDTITAMHNLANSYFEIGRTPEALELREEVLALRLKVNGPHHPDTILAMSNLADSCDHAGRLNELIQMREQVLSIRSEVLGPEHPDTIDAIELLANAYGEAGRRGETVKLREQELALRRKVNGPEDSETIDAISLLANAYDLAARPDDALKLRTEMLALDEKAAKSGHLFTPGGLNDVAKACYAVGRNKEAIALLEQSSKVDPSDTEVSLMLATWQTWFGQDTAYEVTRRRLIQQAEGTDLAATADRDAKACCLRPSVDASLLGKALVLAQRAVKLGKNDTSLPWFELGLGLAEYRNGQYAAACQTLTNVEETVGDNHAFPVGLQNEIKGTARLIRIMSLFRQDKLEPARKLLDQAEAQMPPRSKDESKPFLDGKPASYDDLIWWLFFKEAKALIEGSSAPVAEPPEQR